MHRIDWRLFVAIALPVVFIVVLVGLYVIPNALAQPQYDFIFTENQYNYNQNYSLRLVNDKIEAAPINDYNTTQTKSIDLSQIQVKRYNQVLKKVETLSAKEANTLNLSDQTASPDGFTIGGSSNYGGLVTEVLVGGQYDSYNTLYLIKGLAKKKIDLGTTRYGFHFIAWVIQ